MIVVQFSLTCTTELSCTLARAPMRIGPLSPRITVPNQIDASSPTSTSPISTAVGAMKADAATFGRLPRDSMIMRKKPHAARGGTRRSPNAKGSPEAHPLERTPSSYPSTRDEGRPPPQTRRSRLHRRELSVRRADRPHPRNRRDRRARAREGRVRRPQDRLLLPGRPRPRRDRAQTHVPRPTRGEDLSAYPRSSPTSRPGILRIRLRHDRRATPARLRRPWRLEPAPDRGRRLG